MATSSSRSNREPVDRTAIIENAKRWGIAVVFPIEGWHPMIGPHAGPTGTRNRIRKREVTGAAFKNRADQSLRKFSWDV